jgi:Protein of unknown function (DUF1194)
VRRLTAAALLVGNIVTAAPPEARAGEAPTATDANLVTALDVSDSIMRHEEWIEFAGMSNAIQSDDFLDAATAGRHGRIGFAVIVWSSAERPDVIVPWTIIESKQDIQRVADRLTVARTVYGFDARMGNGEVVAAHRGDDGGSAAPARRTDLSAALEFSADLLRTAPFLAAREVINICGNGADNVHAGPAVARDRALSAGMVINGLIIGARPGVADYYRAHVQGGTGSFVLEASDPKDVAAAMLQKFLRDLNVSRAPPGRLAGLSTASGRGGPSRPRRKRDRRIRRSAADRAAVVLDDRDDRGAWRHAGGKVRAASRGVLEG